METTSTTELQKSDEEFVDECEPQEDSEQSDDAARSLGEDIDVAGMTSLQIDRVYPSSEQSYNASSAGDSSTEWDQSHNASSAGDSTEWDQFHDASSQLASSAGESLMQASWRGQISLPHSKVLPKSVPQIDDAAECALTLRDAFIKNMTKYKGVAVAPLEEFELKWTTMEYELEQYIGAGLVPQDSIASTGLSEKSYGDFKLCAEELQNNLFEENLLESLGHLRGFRRLFSRSTDPVLKNAFRGRPIEILQNIFYGGDGILPEDRMLLDDPFHYSGEDNKGFLQSLNLCLGQSITMETTSTTELQKSDEEFVDECEPQEDSEQSDDAARSLGEDIDVAGMTSLQIDRVYPSSEQSHNASSAGDSSTEWDQSHNASSAGDSSTEWDQFHNTSFQLASSAGESLMQASWRGQISLPHSKVLPKSVPQIDDAAECALRDAFIKNMTKYEGVAVAPLEAFELKWTTMEYELEQYIGAGLVPQDSIASTGLNEKSYRDFKLCAEELQNNLFEENLLESLGHLRGFRRLFSRSTDPVLKHAFRGRPIEILQNIFYGGDGILPEDRMLLDDPFHYSREDNKDGYMFDD